MQFYMQSEKVSHQQTCSALERERDRARLAEAELAILRRQLHREKATFEKALVVYTCDTCSFCTTCTVLCMYVRVFTWKLMPGRCPCLCMLPCSVYVIFLHANNTFI